jgi:hypothetical protein
MQYSEGKGTTHLVVSRQGRNRYVAAVEDEKIDGPAVKGCIVEVPGRELERVQSALSPSVQERKMHQRRALPVPQKTGPRIPVPSPRPIPTSVASC